MQLLEQTHRNQSALASYCRTGNLTTIPGINVENISHYRRLVFNVVDDMLQSAFPLTHKLLKAKEWNGLTHEFFSTHACHSPQVWYMPKEFYEYMAATDQKLLNKYPHLLELMWFEWLEVELFMMEDIAVSYITTGDPEKDKIVLNPEIHFQHFKYPVHLKKAKKIEATDEGNYYLSLHRIPDSGDVLFTDLSPAFVRLMELLAEAPKTVTDLIQQLCTEFQIGLTEEITAMCKEFIQTGLTSRLIIGFNKP